MPRSLRTAVALGALAIWTAAVVAGGQAGRTLQRMPVNGGEVEYEVSGSGEPVLLIHGTGVAATFAPTMTEPSLAGYRLIRYHRRGFAGSARSPVPFSMKDQAADARAVLKALGITRAHIVGHSFGASTALQLTLDSPDVVHDIVIIEPPVFSADGPVPFAALEQQYLAGDKLGAMDGFSQGSYGAEWRTLAARVPGGPAQVEQDVDTVFRSEIQAMRGWRFGAAEGARITMPIIYLTGGGRHGNSRNQLQMWIPRMEQQVLPGVTHAMLMENPKLVADAIAAWVKRHPF